MHGGCHREHPGGGPVIGELDDGDLLTLSARHPEAFGAFYRRHATELLAYIARRTLDPDVAAELVAETFAEAFASRASYRDLGEGGGPWLYGIARHQLGRYFRRGAVDARARSRLGLPERALSPEDHERVEELADLTALRDAVREAFGHLPRGERHAVQARVVDGLTYAEVARRLACSQQAARARVSRGVRRLARWLAPIRADLEGGRRESTAIELPVGGER
jgi:RNA polymerase sigma factor (sigma-70 family)